MFKLGIIFWVFSVCLTLMGCQSTQQQMESMPIIQSIHKKIWTYQKEERPFALEGNVVLVGGCFDILHFGHLTFLQSAKNQGDHLVVALESDAAISAHKKRKSIHSIQQRAEILASLLFVDEVIILPHLKGYDDYFSLVQLIHPHVIAVTEGDPQMTNKERQMAQLGGRVVVVTPVVQGLSTSKIIATNCPS